MAERGKAKVSLGGVQETLLVTLYAKHFDNTQIQKPILGDTWATYVADQIDYDWGSLQMSPDRCAAPSSRGFIFDRWTREFLDERKDDDAGTTVLHLACGLDARSLRLRDTFESAADNRVRWIDVDLPDVVDLRRTLMPEPEANYTLLAVDVTDDAWLESVPNDRPTVIVAEGLFMYVSEEDGKGLLRRLVDRFPQGGRLIFDGVSSLFIKAHEWRPQIQPKGAIFQWGIDDPKALEGVHERLRLIDDLHGPDHWMEENYPWRARWTIYLLKWIPGFRNIMRFMRFTF